MPTHDEEVLCSDTTKLTTTNETRDIAGWVRDAMPEEIANSVTDQQAQALIEALLKKYPELAKQYFATNTSTSSPDTPN